MPVVDAADAVGSTDAIRKFVAAAQPGDVIAIGTEVNMVNRLAAENPDSTIFCLDPVDLPVLDHVPHPSGLPGLDAGRARRGRDPQRDRGRRRRRRATPRWRSSGCSRRCPADRRDRTPDPEGRSMRVIIIGSGVAGLTAALDAVDAGHDVAVLTKADARRATPATPRAASRSSLDRATTPCQPRRRHPGRRRRAERRGPRRRCSARAVRPRCASSTERGVALRHHRRRRAGPGSGGCPRARPDPARRTATPPAPASRRPAATGCADAGIAAAGPHHRASTSCMDGGRAVGVRLLDGTELRADAVILATGGAGQLFRTRRTPRSPPATGVAMALRAGAVAGGPGVLPVPPHLPGRAGQLPDLRGGPRRGGDADRRRRSPVHDSTSTRPPSSPRATWWPAASPTRWRASRAPRSGWTPPHLGGEFLAQRFPNIDAACRAQGFAWDVRPDPGHPGRALLHGRRPHRRLGTHLGARVCTPSARSPAPVCTAPTGWPPTRCSRALVYGARVAEALDGRPDAAGDRRSPTTGPSPLVGRTSSDAAGRASRSTARPAAADVGRRSGCRRTAADLREALATLRGWRTPEVTDAKAAEDANLLLVARAVTASALRRTESRGGHFRADFPEPDPAQAVHSGLVLARDAADRRSTRVRSAMSLQRTRSSASSTWRSRRTRRSATSLSQTFVPGRDHRHRRARRPRAGVFAGAEVFEVAMTAPDDAVKVTLLIADGDRFEAGQVLARVEGPARAVLQAERVALNLVQRMCGIATLTARYVAAVAGTDARVVDTRKTTPGLRALERHAVRLRRRPQPPLLAVRRRDGQGQPPGRGRRHRGSHPPGARGAPAHDAPRGGGRPARPDRRGAGRRPGHDHARQLLPRRPGRGRPPDRRPGHRRGLAAASPWTPSPTSPRPGST